MKVLVLSVTAGQGHNATGQGLMSYLEELGVECTMLNTLKYISPVVGTSLDKGYLYIGKISPKMNAVLYNSAEKNLTRKNRTPSTDLYAPLLYKKLEKYLLKYDPDVVVCTHIFAAGIMHHAREKGNIRRIPIIGINTDFAIHPYWEDSSPDYLVLASSQMIRQAQKRGFDARFLLPMGIPVHKRFCEKLDKAKARALLGVENKRTLLMIGGSMGFGRLEDGLKQLAALPGDYQVLVVCGSNKALKKRLEKDKAPNTHIFGYVDNVEVFMDAADCVFTKPGGLTVSECIAKGLPMILTTPIPGVEERNMQFLLNNAMALAADGYLPLDDVLHTLFENPHRLEQMHQMQRLYGCENGGRTLAEWLVRAVPGGGMNTSG
ncbi:MAG: MGDG synthase family glycosyltransferase, partial [Bacillota bacterium]